MASGWRALFRAVLVFVLAGFSSALSAGNLHYDQRVKSQSAKVGTIVFDLAEGRSLGTAILVSPCEIMTNFHVVFGPWYVTALKPPSRANHGVFTVTSVTLPDGSHPQAIATPVEWGGYSGPDRQMRRPKEDWTLLSLETCLGRTYGYFTLNDPRFEEEVADPHALAAIGYSSGRQMIDGRCSISRNGGFAENGAFMHDCVTLSGDSGGPIFNRYSHRAVAMASGFQSVRSGMGCGPSARQTAGKDRATDCVNVAVPFDLGFVRQIESVILAVDTQRELLRHGYDAGAFGDIHAPAFHKAVAQAKSDLGLPRGGDLTSMVRKALCMREIGSPLAAGQPLKRTVQ